MLRSSAQENNKTTQSAEQPVDLSVGDATGSNARLNMMVVHPEADRLYKALTEPPIFTAKAKFFERKAGESAFQRPPTTERAVMHQGPIAIVDDGRIVLQVRNAPPNFAWSATLDLSKYDIGAYKVDSSLTGPNGVTREQLRTAGNDPLSITFSKPGLFHDASLPSRAADLTVHPQADRLYKALTEHPIFTAKAKFFERKAGESAFQRPPTTAGPVAPQGPIAIVDDGRIVLQVRNAPPNFAWSATLDLSKYDIGVYKVDSRLTGPHGVTREQLRTAGNDPLSITFTKLGAFRDASLPSRAAELTVHPQADRLYKALTEHPIFTSRAKFFERKAGESAFQRPPTTERAVRHRGPIAIVDDGRIVLQVRNASPNFAWSATLDLSKYDIGAYMVDSSLTGPHGVTREQLKTAGNDPLSITFEKDGVLRDASLPSRAAELTVHPEADRLYKALTEHPIFTSRAKFFERKAGESAFQRHPKTERAVKHQGPIAIVDDGRIVLQVRNAPPNFAWSATLDLSKYDIGAYKVDSSLTGPNGVTREQLRTAGNDPLSITFGNDGLFHDASLPSRAAELEGDMNLVESNAFPVPMLPSLRPQAPTEAGWVEGMVVPGARGDVRDFLFGAFTIKDIPIGNIPLACLQSDNPFAAVHKLWWDPAARIFIEQPQDQTQALLPPNKVPVQSAPACASSPQSTDESSSFRAALLAHSPVEDVVPPYASASGSSVIQKPISTSPEYLHFPHAALQASSTGDKSFPGAGKKFADFVWLSTSDDDVSFFDKNNITAVIDPVDPRNYLLTAGDTHFCSVSKAWLQKNYGDEKGTLHNIPRDRSGSLRLPGKIHLKDGMTELQDAKFFKVNDQGTVSITHGVKNAFTVRHSDGTISMIQCTKDFPQRFLAALGGLGNKEVQLQLGKDELVIDSRRIPWSEQEANRQKEALATSFDPFQQPTEREKMSVYDKPMSLEFDPLAYRDTGSVSSVLGKHSLDDEDEQNSSSISFGRSAQTPPLDPEFAKKMEIMRLAGGAADRSLTEEELAIFPGYLSAVLPAVHDLLADADLNPEIRNILQQTLSTMDVPSFGWDWDSNDSAAQLPASAFNTPGKLHDVTFTDQVTSFQKFADENNGCFYDVALHNSNGNSYFEFSSVSIGDKASMSTPFSEELQKDLLCKTGWNAVDDHVTGVSYEKSSVPIALCNVQDPENPNLVRTVILPSVLEQDGLEGHAQGPVMRFYFGQGKTNGTHRIKENIGTSYDVIQCPENYNSQNTWREYHPLTGQQSAFSHVVLDEHGRLLVIDAGQPLQQAMQQTYGGTNVPAFSEERGQSFYGQQELVSLQDPQGGYAARPLDCASQEPAKDAQDDPFGSSYAMEQPHSPSFYQRQWTQGGYGWR